jgi:hypothetical protein
VVIRWTSGKCAWTGLGSRLRGNEELRAYGIKELRAYGIKELRAYGIKELRAYGIKELRAYGIKGILYAGMTRHHAVSPLSFPRRREPFWYVLGQPTCMIDTTYLTYL